MSKLKMGRGTKCRAATESEIENKSGVKMECGSGIRLYHKYMGKPGTRKGRTTSAGTASILSILHIYTVSSSDDALADDAFAHSAAFLKTWIKALQRGAGT
ncbi:hypothetical protein EVAR_63856_1 [Eumeta japonica]|uniref:Uncharacterized protein n=1 Tax=Eumeta variegata TaxID=151549 RepID=A0A4C1SF88_EUMVA|nr:hypothetical protein EVAR_63856_1 [Eumeta japonica]